MIKMCDLPRYADADMEEIKKMKEARQIAIMISILLVLFLLSLLYAILLIVFI